MNSGENLKTKTIEVATLNDAMSLFNDVKDANVSEAERVLGISRFTIRAHLGHGSKLVQIFRDDSGKVTGVEFINKK